MFQSQMLNKAKHIKIEKFRLHRHKGVASIDQDRKRLENKREEKKQLACIVSDAHMTTN